MLSSYKSSIIMDEPDKIQKEFILESKLVKKTRLKYNLLGNILLEYVDDIYIYLEIQYKNNYIKIYYNNKTNNQTFLYLSNHNKYYIQIDKLKIFILRELDKIDKKDFYNVTYDLFIDSIEYWFNHSYSDDVFL